ncbi:hypothetical protein AXG93_1028s1230 [Marchantia polymorpha subsp. ruderalis]|uniref:Uncharacterized protein n=1 Tax=Marchantia polymorpha subsp. ruderalis TaxID=1480154 RepID=A0A176W8R1_MARPO|nr:hypothetical protein AXG93_1028s1230 [Marchantia polymorpha subsp. ruderalis]
MSSVVMMRLPLGVALARGRVRAQQARRLVVQAERAAIMRHSRGVSQLKQETAKKIHQNIDNLSMIFDFEGTLVAAGAGLGEKDEQLGERAGGWSGPDQNLSLVVKNGGFPVKFTDEDGRLAKSVDVYAVIAFMQSLVVGSKELISVQTDGFIDV